MATIAQYVQKMRSTHQLVAWKMGTDVSGMQKSTRAAVAAVFVVVAVVVKTMVDKGLITDADLNAQLTALGDDVYADEPN